MLDVSFSNELEAGMEISVGPADQTAIALAAEDSLDDICDQIRMLRSAVMPAEVLGGRSGLDSFGQAASPEKAFSFWPARAGPSSMGPGAVPSLSSAASLREQFASQRTLSTSSTAYTAKAASPSKFSFADQVTEPVTATASAATLSYSEEATASSAKQDPLMDAVSSLDPIRMRHTLWEERQLQRCFRIWVSLPSGSDGLRGPVHGSAQTTNSLVCECGDIFSLDATFCRQCGSRRPGFEDPKTGAGSLDANQRRRDLCFRVWHRICKDQRAEELALSLRLLDSQVSRQLRRGLARWWTWAHGSMGRKAVHKYHGIRRRFNLRHWHQVASVSAEHKVVRDQAATLLRAWLLRQSTRLWASRAPELKRSRRSSNHRFASLMCIAFRAWQHLPKSAQEDARQAMGHAQLLLHMNQRMALRRWLESTQEFKSQKKSVVHSQRVMLDFSRRTALRRLAHVALRLRKLHRHHHFATTRADHRCQAVALLAWARWSYRRLQRRRLYMGHVATRVLPRMLRAAFELWVSTFRRLQRHHAALQRAKIVMALALKGRSFHSWLGVIQSKRKGLNKLRGLTEDPAVMYFRCWCAAIHSLKKERVMEFNANHHHSRALNRMLFDLFCIGVAANRLEIERESRAIAVEARRLQVNSLQLWRVGVAIEKQEQCQSSLAESHNGTCVSKETFAAWRRNVDLNRRERKQHAAADSCKLLRLASTALRGWCQFLAFRKYKCHAPKADRCKQVIQRLRHHRHLRAWSQLIDVTRRHQTRGGIRTSGALQAFFGWGALMKERRHMGQEVFALQCNQRRAQVFNQMKVMWRAGQMCRDSVHGRLLRGAWNSWVAILVQALAENTQKEWNADTYYAQSLLAVSLSALRVAVLQTAELNRCVSRLSDALQLVERSQQQHSQQRSINTWCDWVEMGRVIDDAQLELAYYAFRQLCFKYWSRYCQHLAHKRLVHDLCEHHRCTRLLRRSFEGWCLTQLHLAEVVQAVYYWSQGLVQQRALDFFKLWRSLTVQRRHSRSLGVEIVARRQEHFLLAWLRCSQKRQSVWHLADRSLRRHHVAFLVAWHEHAAFRTGRKYRVDVLTEAVHQARRRRWIDHWSESGRWARLGHVAESWDHQVFSRRCFSIAFEVWAALWALRIRAQEAMQRVGALRASRFLRPWGKLTRMIEARYKIVLAKICVEWYDVVLLRKAELRNTNKINFVRIKDGFRKFRLFFIDHKLLRLKTEEKVTSVINLQLKRAIVTWDKSTRPARVLNKAGKAEHGDPRFERAQACAMKASSLLKRRRQEVLKGWMEVWTTHGAKKKTLNPYDGQEVLHQPDTPPRLGQSPARTSPRPRPVPSLRVTIIGASSLSAGSTWHGHTDALCICEIPGRPSTQFKTQVITNNPHPVWNEVWDIENYPIGQPLSFTIVDKDGWPRPDRTIATTTVDYEHFYPFGFPMAGYGDGIALESSEGGSVLRIRVEVKNAPHLRIRRACPTVARAIVPITPGLILVAWQKHASRRLHVGTMQALVQSKAKHNLRARVLTHWAELFDHHASTRFANGMLDRMKASRIMQAWSRYASFHQRFQAHVSHMHDLKNQQSARACFDRWHESLREHYHIAKLWLDRWRYWSSALILAWRGFVRERRQLRRSLLLLRTGVMFMRSCRKADLIALCGISTLLRECFSEYARLAKKAALLRNRCAQLGEHVTNARQRRRLCGWAACARSCTQEEVGARDFAELLGLPLPSSTEGHQRSGNVYVLNMSFAMWAELESRNRILRHTIRTICYHRRCRRRLKGLEVWRTRARMRRERCLALHGHHGRRVFNGLRAAFQAWQQQASFSRRQDRRSVAYRNLHLTGQARKVLGCWAECAHRDAKIRRLFHHLDNVHCRWVTEDRWRENAAQNPTLRAMFCRFATAFDAHQISTATTSSSSSSSALSKDPRSFPRAVAFDAVLSLIWCRQQLSVAFSRLKGQHDQSWDLGLWDLGLSPLLSRDNTEYAQAGRRLPVMLARLQDEASPTNMLAMVQAARRNGEPKETRSMWLALADLLVVHYPGWPSHSPPPADLLAQHQSPAPVAQCALQHQHCNMKAKSSALTLHDDTPRFGAAGG